MIRRDRLEKQLLAAIEERVFKLVLVVVLAGSSQMSADDSKIA
jgi:hypothetical protein